MTVSQYIASWLIKRGVTTVYGLPGEEDLHLLDAIREANIEFIRVDHEATAGFMAAAEARITGDIAVVLTTLGPGATNVLTSIAHSQLAGIPILLITADKAFNVPHSSFQQIDAVSLFKPVSNFSERLERADRIPSMLESAYQYALYSTKPGVSHIQIPYDISKSTIRIDNIEIGSYSKSIASDDTISRAKEYIINSKHPLIVSAGGSQDRKISQVLNKIVTKYKIPHISTAMGKGSIDEMGENYLGSIVSEFDDPLNKAINFSDLIITVGYQSHERPFSLNTNGEKKVLSFSTHFLDLDPLFMPDVQLVGDIPANVAKVFSEIEVEYEEVDFYSSLNRFVQGVDIDQYEIYLRSMIEGLNSILSPEDTVVLDNGSYKWAFSRYFRCRRTDQIILDNALATMGGGIAMGASISRLIPKNKVVTIVGDGGFLMSSYDLGTVRRFANDQCIIMIRNERYEMIARKQKKEGLEEFGVDLDLPDVGKIVEGYGIPYSWMHIREIEQLLKEVSREGCRFIQLTYSESY